MNKKLIAAASVATIAAGGGAAAIASAQTPYNPYNPYTTTTTPGPTTTVVVPPTTTQTTPTTPTIPVVLPRASTTVNRALSNVAGDLRRVRASRRTKFKVTIDNAAPGAYSFIVYKRGTKTKLITGKRTLKGTTVKPAKVTLRITKAGRSYFKRLKRSGRNTVRTDQRLSFNPTAPGKTVARRRVTTVGL